MTDRRVSVQTYVPEYQSDVWAEEAEEMGVSRSEYVRMMVQAGRRDFDLATDKESKESNVETSDNNRGDSNLESRVMTALDSKGPLDWEALVNEITQGIETQLENTLDKLQSSNDIKYNGRHGGYTVVDDE